MEKSQYDLVVEAAEFLKSKKFLFPEIGIVLGTGLSGFINEINRENEISYGEIPHFPVSTVEFHSRKLIYGDVEGKKVIVMQGRFHFYEGHAMEEIIFPIRVLKMLGVKYLLISNAGGAINPQFKKGELMLIEDHVNLLPAHPLIGENDENFGTRFPDMSKPYDNILNEKLKSIAAKNNIVLHEGVYVAVAGPNLETRAEYRFLWNIGADAVGMSTVPEVIAANHLKLPCSAISVLTDECDPDNLKEININEIIEMAKIADIKLSLLFKNLVKAL